MLAGGMQFECLLPTPSLSENCEDSSAEFGGFTEFKEEGKPLN